MVDRLFSCAAEKKSKIFFGREIAKFLGFFRLEILFEQNTPLRVAMLSMLQGGSDGDSIRSLLGESATPQDGVWKKMSNEKLYPLSELDRFFPRPIPPATKWRWVLRGVRGRKLETLLVGGRRYFSAEAVARFIDRGAEPVETAPAPRTPRQRQSAIAAAEKELSAAGI